MASQIATFVRRLRYGKPVVVVSGLPRSGTSMTMKMLEAGGLELVTDGIRTADEDNPKGYFELERVKNLHQEADRSWLRDARGRGLKVISFLLDKLPPTNNYRVLFMHRNLDEVLASQAKMLDRRGETTDTDDDRMKELWDQHLFRTKLLLRREPRFETLHLRYTDVLQAPEEAATTIRDFLGIDLEVRRMVEVVDPNLYRNRRQSA